MRADVLSQVMQPGEFSDLEPGLTFHMRARGENGDLLGVVVHDERENKNDPGKKSEGSKKTINTIVAERGQVSAEGGRAQMTLYDGQVITQKEDEANVHFVDFKSYTFDMGDFTAKSGKREAKTEERDLSELIWPDRQSDYYRENQAGIRSEINQRLSTPVYPFVYALLALLYLGRPRTTREGRTSQLFTAFLIGAIMLAVGISGVQQVGKKLWAVGLIYGVPGRLDFGVPYPAAIQHPGARAEAPASPLAVLPSAPEPSAKRGRRPEMKTSGTLGRYMVGRFTTTIMGVFLLMLILIFFIDFVEVLRQGSKRDDIGPGTLALISVLRIPIFAELAFPFAVLIGTIGAYMALSRSSELTIVRAAGVSVWQFLKPSLFVGMALGVLAVTVYNPAASAMKAELERIQTSLFDSQKTFGTSAGTGNWKRQESVDGPSILQAKTTADHGLTLGGVTVLQFDLNNRFYELVQANKAELRQGYWLLQNVTVQSSGEQSRHYAEYAVSTYLSPAQVMSSLGSVETLSFWQLPDFINFAKKAGIPTVRYELQYQLFLVRPLLMAAMVLIAATSSLKPFRFGKIQTMVLTGLGGGFGFFIFSEFSRKVGISGLVPVAVAAWSPALIAFLLSVTVLLHQEDG